LTLVLVLVLEQRSLRRQGDDGEGPRKREAGERGQGVAPEVEESPAASEPVLT
jgi:hypothetical protein